MSEEGVSKKMRRADYKTILYAHKGCNDGHVAAALCVLGLLKDGQPESSIQLQFVSAGLRDIKIPSRGSEVTFESGVISPVRRAIFVDLCPTDQHAQALEEYFDTILVYDHHRSAKDFVAQKTAHPKWQFNFGMHFCGSHLLFDELLHNGDEPIQIGDSEIDMEAIGRVVQRTDEYDTWKAPTTHTFKFSIASNLIWGQCTVRGQRTTIPQLLEFIRRICTVSDAEVDALATPLWNALRFEWQTTARHLLQLPTKSGQSIEAVVWFGDGATNPSIGCHMMLEEDPAHSVCICVFRRIEDGKIVWNASLRSRGIDLTAELDWARGHANACGGILPDALVEKLLEPR
jgi:hypothetical protein